MTKQTTVRLPDELAATSEAVARVLGTSLNELIIEALQGAIDRIRQDEAFKVAARDLLEHDQEVLGWLAG